MPSSIRPGTIAAAALPLLLTTACADFGGDAEEIQVVAGAITSVTNTLDENGLKTDYNAQVAIGGATDHVLTVWVGKNASNQPQIVGQSFAATGNQIGQVFGGAGRKLLAFSNTTRAKSSPAVAWDSSGNDKFLVVWQDDYSATDSDIWGALIDDKGDLITLPNGQTNPFVINYDGQSEKKPSVAFVRDVNSFIVAYTRKISGGATTLSAQWVNTNGVVSSFFDVISSGVDQTFPPTVTYARFQNIMMFTFNDNRFTFGDTNYPTGPVGLISQTIAGARGLVGAAAQAPSASKKYALAWIEGTGTSSVIKGRAFSEGCYSAACAPVTTLISAGGAVTNLHNPAIAAAGLGFAVYSGSEGSPWRIRYASFGGATGSSSSITPDCAGPLQSAGGHSLGSPDGVIAAASLPNVLDEAATRSFLLYDSFCGTPSTYPKEMVSAVKPTDTSDIVSFNVSTNGQ